MSRPLPTERALLNGPDGTIEALIDAPEKARGIAVVAHPHPLFHGANTNKIAHTLARTFRDLGYAAVRPNFRGVGESAGEHDHGIAETEDLLAVLAWAQSRWGSLPIGIGGFSFGAFVQTRVVARLEASITPPRHVVLVGVAAGEVTGARSYTTEPVPSHSLVIHGELDETVALANVLDWARPQSLPVIVVPGADHFFHGKLNIIRDIVLRSWQPL
ncbi:MAG: alpha/beta hydrolase [Zoogloeaceae bacterium]|nr:alpha/beta hydrolase [Rhodocyclaceae bacterium]MCP5232176.1 alpha/beta hydrolase [Zoogloeaceae bacterium]MCP5240573.1 alpha/beta hydrolase [Zoogloeaceae bacterium]MCP5253314.1 alpha/beta hydrolase [Zoogloeaceae bacterium]MCP5293573.1 alpha/beta hydrolase [Zoogloeaceae bacterium]